MEIVYTGLRPGEKLHETLLNSREPDLRPRHPLISHVCVPPLSLDEAAQVCLEEGSLHPRARLIAAAQHGAWAASRPRTARLPTSELDEAADEFIEFGGGLAVSSHAPPVRVGDVLGRTLPEDLGRCSLSCESAHPITDVFVPPAGSCGFPRATRSRNWNVRCQVDPSIRTTARRCSWVIVITRSLPSCARSSGVMERDVSCAMVTPSSDMTRWARLSPAIGNVSVPAEAATTVGPRPVSRARAEAPPPSVIDTRWPCTRRALGSHHLAGSFRSLCSCMLRTPTRRSFEVTIRCGRNVATGAQHSRTDQADQLDHHAHPVRQRRLCPHGADPPQVGCGPVAQAVGSSSPRKLEQRVSQLETTGKPTSCRSGSPPNVSTSVANRSPLGSDRTESGGRAGAEAGW